MKAAWRSSHMTHACAMTTHEGSISVNTHLCMTHTGMATPIGPKSAPNVTESKLRDTKRKATPMLSGVGPTRMMERILYSNEYRIKGRDDHILLLFVRSSLCPFCLSLGFLSLPYLSFLSVTWLPATSLSALLVCHLASCHFPICRFFSSVTWLPVTSLSAVSSCLPPGFPISLFLHFYRPCFAIILAK